MIHVVEFQARAQLVVVGDTEKKLYDLDDGAQGVRLQEFRHVRGVVEAAVVEELRVMLIQHTASGVGQGQVDEFPLFRERRGEPYITQLFLHYVILLNTKQSSQRGYMGTHMKRWHGEGRSQRYVEPSRAFACEGPVRVPGKTAIHTALTGLPARRAHTLAATSALNTPSANATTQSFARPVRLLAPPHCYKR